jgi:hypothetical protein
VERAVYGTKGELLYYTRAFNSGVTAMSGKREMIEPNGDKRYVRRDKKGQIKESDDQGRSLSKDVKQPAETKVKAGYGDNGDQKKR